MIDKQFSTWFVSGGILGYTSLFFGFEFGYSKKYSPGFFQVTLLMFGLRFALQLHGKRHFKHQKDLEKQLTDIKTRHLISTATNIEDIFAK
jgi:hypothetical protein